MAQVGKVWRGFYADSITLMQVAEAVRRQRGVDAVALLMGTPANHAALREAGLWSHDLKEAGPTDLILALHADEDASAQAAVGRAEELLTTRRPRADGAVEQRPRSLTSAARAGSGANLAVISVPGPHAVNEAHQALSRGLHVFLFSDGVSLDDEIALKRRASARDLLVMGPECGTSILGGVGVGFANAVRRGAIGLLGASGTGLQEVTTLADRLGGGISHAIGTGGRDLHEAVDGMTTRQALRCLAADRDTRVIVLVSKPASARVCDAVLTAAAATGKPVVACLLGWTGATPSRAQVVQTLEEAAIAAVRTAGGTPVPLERPMLSRDSIGAVGGVRGFFTGGTLCEEARRVVGEGPHRFVDFGGAEYTRGRPHPMIDPGRRNAAVASAGDDPDARVVLVDVVLGHGAHPDPAGALAIAISDARVRAERAGRALHVVANVVGTDADPQGRSGQEKALRATGAIVCPSNCIAAEVARALVTNDR